MYSCRFLFFAVQLIIIIHAHEPLLRCHYCEDCRENYEKKGGPCSPRMYFCVFVEYKDGKIDRFCGDQGNCSSVKNYKVCSMCSADYCNDVYRSEEDSPTASMTLYLAIMLINMLLV